MVDGHLTLETWFHIHNRESVHRQKQLIASLSRVDSSSVLKLTMNVRQMLLGTSHQGVVVP